MVGCEWGRITYLPYEAIFQGSGTRKKEEVNWARRDLLRSLEGCGSCFRVR